MFIGLWLYCSLVYLQDLSPLITKLENAFQGGVSLAERAFLSDASNFCQVDTHNQPIQ